MNNPLSHISWQVLLPLKSPKSSEHYGHSNNAEPSLQISVDLSRLSSKSLMLKLISQNKKHIHLLFLFQLQWFGGPLKSKLAIVVKSCILPLKSFYKISVEGITLMPKRDSQNVLLQKYLACQGAELYCVLLLQSKKIILYRKICLLVRPSVHVKSKKNIKRW